MKSITFNFLLIVLFNAESNLSHAQNIRMDEGHWRLELLGAPHYKLESRGISRN